MGLELGTVPQDVRAALFDMLRGDMESDRGFDLDSEGRVMRDDPESELPSATVAGAMAYRRARTVLDSWQAVCEPALRSEFDALYAELLPPLAEDRYLAFTRIQGDREEFPAVRRLYYISHHGVTGELLEAAVDLHEDVPTTRRSAPDDDWGS